MGILIKNVQLLQDKIGTRRDVYIEGSRIAGIDKMPENFTADETIDGTNRMMMPGFVNGHTHAYMSVFRNYADDLPFDEWLFGKIDPLESKMTAEEAYWGNLLSISEMLHTGTTCFIDQQMFPKMAVKACADTGMRALITRGLVGSDRNDEAFTRRLAEAFDEMDYARENSVSNVTFGLGPHAIYTCGGDAIARCAEIAEEKGLPINIHLTETQYEFDTCMKEHGMTPVAYLESLGVFKSPTILAHCVYLTDEDYEILKDPNITVVTNPASNMKLANGFAPVARMLKEGIRVALGTDGASSNNALNMFREMTLLSLTQKGAGRDSLALTAEETMTVALENGYEAIGEAERMGRIEKGCVADVILIDETAPNFQPHFNWKAALVYSSTGTEVTDVLVGGRILMRNKVLTTIDEERVNYEIRRITENY